MDQKKTRKKGYQFNSERLFLAANQETKNTYAYLNSSPKGLSAHEVETRQKMYGKNEIAHERKDKLFVMFIKTFINPFIGILMFLALLSLVIDVLMAEPDEREWATVIIITTMVAISGLLRFYQEWKSSKATDTLKKMVNNTASVYRYGEPETREINITDLVPGDVISLSAGDMIPADMRIIESKDLFISQSSLTGESDSIEKTPELQDRIHRTGSVVELDNICFMGSNVVSGSGKGIIVTTGRHTYLGVIARNLVGERAQTSFDKGINNVSLLLIRFMLIMVPFVFFINGITKGDWFDAFIFAVSVAVGLTPEMLPMIVTSNLAKGAITMSKHKTIVKNMNAIQSFGAMNILCTDKTGTLTQDKIILERYLNVQGQEDLRILRHAYFNSYFQTGLKNLMDRAILSHCKELGFENIEHNYAKIDEIPFDFTRRRMSVVIENDEKKRQIITKGAVEEMLQICTHAEYNGVVTPLSKELKREIYKRSEQLNKEGMRVLAIAHKSWIEKESAFSVADESGMVLLGYLAFLDPPKPSAYEAIRTLHTHGVEVKVLSGDNDAVTKTVCQQVGIDTTHILLGTEIEEMSDEELEKKAKIATIFAKLTPMQKARIITLLQKKRSYGRFLRRRDQRCGSPAPGRYRHFCRHCGRHSERSG